MNRRKTKVFAPGTIIQTPNAGKVIVLEYIPLKKARMLGFSNARAVIRLLDTGTVLNVQCGNIKAGKVRDPRKPTVYGVGYLGADIVIPARGAHPVRDVYDLWANMLKRCYGGYETSYVGCSVDRRWHSFLNFLNTVSLIPGYEEWVKDKSMHLDKDIHVPGNKVYSLNTCQFVTGSENVSESSSRRWAGD